MGQTVLIIAIAGSDCSPSLVQFLLSRGADVSMKTLDGKTAESIAYQQALKGRTACNRVMAMLKAPPQPVAAVIPASMPAGGSVGTVPSGIGTMQPGRWQGMFNATSPRNASVATTVTLLQSGDIAFSAQSGLQGSGRLVVVGDQVSGTATAPSPLDASGQPAFKNPDGSTDIVFRLTGTVSNGVMRGDYASNFEAGKFVLCDSAVYEKTPACKPAQASPGDLLKALGGLAGALKGLSNAR